MSRDVNPIVLEKQLQQLSNELDAAQSALADVDEAATRADVNYELAFARAMMKANGSSAEKRKAEATLATENELWEARMSAQKVRAAKGRISTLGTRIDVGRSLLSSSKASWSAHAGAA